MRHFFGSLSFLLVLSTQLSAQNETWQLGPAVGFEYSLWQGEYEELFPPMPAAVFQVIGRSERLYFAVDFSLHFGRFRDSITLENSWFEGQQVYHTNVGVLGGWVISEEGRPWELVPLFGYHLSGLTNEISGDADKEDVLNESGHGPAVGLLLFYRDPFGASNSAFSTFLGGRFMWRFNRFSEGEGLSGQGISFGLFASIQF